MATVPVWLRGRDIGGGTFSITPLTVASNGALSAATSASSMLGNWEDVSIDSNPEEEEISSADATRQHNELLKDATDITISEILKRNGTNILAGLFASYNVFLVTLVRGGQTWAFYGLRGTYSEQISKGKSLGRATFRMIDPGAANPTYS